MWRGVLPTFSMSPVRMHFWHVVARVNEGAPRPMNSRLNWFIPAGVNRTVGSFGASTSDGFLTHPLEAKKSRYASRSSSVFIAGLGLVPGRSAARRIGRGKSPRIPETAGRFPDGDATDRAGHHRYNSVGRRKFMSDA